jgi:dihydropteroate synthase
MLPLGKKTYIMGILNITPDSFSDGGKYIDLEPSLKKARSMFEEGADIIDIGGESTRPGYKAITKEEEIRRVLPVLSVLAKELDIPISIDTNKSIVAQKALEAGASIVNDIWGLQKDPLIARVAAEYNAGVIIMHNKVESLYSDLIGEIKGYFRKSIDIAKKAGIKDSNIITDPGIGFGKNFEQNLEVLKRLKELKDKSFPMLLGTSRKSFIGQILNLPATDRVEGTAASVVLGIAAGADIVRVHDVKEMYRVVKVADTIIRH